MTTVGKILVCLIMLFSVLFLAFSVVVFTTEKNWNAAAQDLNKKITSLKSEVAAKDTAAKAAAESLKQAKAEYDKQEQNFKGQVSNLEADLKTRSTELEQQRTNVETAQQNTKAALAEAEQRKHETDNLREILTEVQKQANAYGLRQTELNDEIRVLKRQLETATENNKSLRTSVTTLQSALRSAGLQDDPKQLAQRSTVPPDVEGEVKRVDTLNRRVELSIGSDDGLVVGHELEVWRTKPIPDYLGKIRIESVEPDRAVGVVMGKTLHGKKIQEGDLVAPKIRPR
jgi:hypothetical protein